MFIGLSSYLDCVYNVCLVSTQNLYVYQKQPGLLFNVPINNIITWLKGPE